MKDDEFYSVFCEGVISAILAFSGTRYISHLSCLLMTPKFRTVLWLCRRQVGKLFSYVSSILIFFFLCPSLTFLFQVVPTTDHIDTEKLKAREQIKFFEEVLLFEDELHDHGVSSLSVKIVSIANLFKINFFLPFLLLVRNTRLTSNYTVLT